MPGQRRRIGTLLNLASLLGLVMLSSCAQRGSALSEAALAQRILPPAMIAEPSQPAENPDLPNDSAPEPEPPPAFLSLEEAVNLAFLHQPRLRLALARIEEARGRGQAAFAPFLPQVTVLNMGFVGQNPRRPEDGAPIPLAEFADARGEQTFALAELAVQWTIWDFGRTYGRHQQAELGLRIAELQAARASQTVAYEVAAAYYDLLETRARRRVAEESVRRAESVLGIVRSGRLAGLLETDQVLRAEVQLAQARKAVTLSSRDEQVARAALNRAIGWNVSSQTRILDRTDEPAFDLALGDCLQLAVDHRREFQVAQRAMEIAQEGIRVARADFAPRIYVQGMVAGAGGRQTLEGLSESGSINLSWQLYDGGKRAGDLRTADAAVQAAAAQAQVVCDNIAFEVNEAYRDMEAARRIIELSRPQVVQARENLRLVTRKLEAGDATPTDVVDAESSLTRAEQDYFQALYDYLKALARIEYATGIGPLAGSALPEEEDALGHSLGQDDPKTVSQEGRR